MAASITRCHRRRRIRNVCHAAVTTMVTTSVSGDKTGDQTGQSGQTGGALINSMTTTLATGDQLVTTVVAGERNGETLTRP